MVFANVPTNSNCSMGWMVCTKSALAASKNAEFKVPDVIFIKEDSRSSSKNEEDMDVKDNSILWYHQIVL